MRPRSPGDEIGVSGKFKGQGESVAFHLPGSEKDWGKPNGREVVLHS